MTTLLVGLLAIVLLTTPAFGAASKQFLLPGTGVTFKDSGGNVVLPFAGVTSGSGRWSDRYDKQPLASPTGAMPYQWSWACQITLNGTLTAGQTVEIYVAWSDGTNVDGNLPTTSGTLSSDRRRNLKLAGVVQVDLQGIGQASGTVILPLRYFQVAYWDGTNIPLSSTLNVSLCTFTPLNFEMQ